MSDKIDITLPTVGGDSDQWGTELNEALQTISTHSHTGDGDGMKISEDALSLTGGDISTNGGALTQVKTLDLKSDQPHGVINSFHELSGTLFFYDRFGQDVQLITNSAVATGSLPPPSVFVGDDTTSDVVISALDTHTYFGIGSNSQRTVTLPLASAVNGYRYYFIHDISGSANVSHVTVVPTGTDKVNLSSSLQVFGDTLIVRNEDANGWHAWRNTGVELFNSMTSSVTISPTADHVQILKSIGMSVNAYVTGTLIVPTITTAADHLTVSKTISLQKTFVTGSANVSTSLTVGTNIVASGNASITGTGTFGSSLSADSYTSANDSVTISKPVSLQNTHITGTLGVTSTLTVAGSAIIDDDVTITGGLQVFGGIFRSSTPLYPPVLSADVNNYNPSGMSGFYDIILATNNSTTRVISGLGISSANGQEFRLTNDVDSPGDIVLLEESASSSAAGRFRTTKNITLKPGSTVTVCGDANAGRYRVRAMYYAELP